MHPYSVIVKPAVSEKSNDLREDQGKYTFIVRMDSTKNDVKRAIKTIWDVDVESVRINIRRGKLKRRGQRLSLTPKQKRAVVSLKGGAKLPLFEEQ